MDTTYEVTDEGHLKETVEVSPKESIIDPSNLNNEKEWLQKQRQEALDRLAVIDEKIELNAHRIKQCEALGIETRAVTKDVVVDGVLITKGD